MLGKIQAGNPNPGFILISGAWGTERKTITWRFELWWKTSWLPSHCGVDMGWRKGDLWFLHSSGTCKDCIFSSNGNNKCPDFPNHVVLLTVFWMDSFFCLSRVGILLRRGVIWEEGKEQSMEVNDWNDGIISMALHFFRSRDGVQRRRESFVSMWITTEAKGWLS